MDQKEFEKQVLKDLHENSINRVANITFGTVVILIIAISFLIEKGYIGKEFGCLLFGVLFLGNALVHRYVCGLESLYQDINRSK